jgi:hypothetical protein
VPSRPRSSVQIRVQNAFLCVLRVFVVFFAAAERLRCGSLSGIDLHRFSYGRDFLCFPCVPGVINQSWNSFDVRESSNEVRSNAIQIK